MLLNESFHRLFSNRSRLLYSTGHIRVVAGEACDDDSDDDIVPQQHSSNTEDERRDDEPHAERQIESGHARAHGLLFRLPIVIGASKKHDRGADNHVVPEIARRCFKDERCDDQP